MGISLACHRMLKFHYGHLGMDVLSQAREVRLDFTAMTGLVAKLIEQSGQGI